MKRLPVEEVEAHLPGTEVEVVLLLGAEALFPGAGLLLTEVLPSLIC